VNAHDAAPAMLLEMDGRKIPDRSEEERKKMKKKINV